MDNQELVRPLWWVLVIGILQVAKFLVLIVLVLVRVQLFFPQKIENEKLKFTVFSIAHNDACSAFPMVLLGIVGMTAVSVPLFKSVEMIQISYFVLFLLIHVCEWVSWGTEYADLVDIPISLLLLLAHCWMLKMNPFYRNF